MEFVYRADVEVALVLVGRGTKRLYGEARFGLVGKAAGRRLDYLAQAVGRQPDDEHVQYE